MELVQVAQAGGVGLLGSALVLGIRHGIDWDHIAAIADITSTTTNVESADAAVGARRARFGALEARAVWLASLYALGHATVVAALGALALYFEALLPEWIDPIMERVVGLTLVALGLWVFYSLIHYWRGEGDFRLQSR
jgi:cytochrome c biogenesis protein CcdA